MSYSSEPPPSYYDESQYYAVDPRIAGGRVTAPAIGLIILAIVNLLGGLLILLSGLAVSQVTSEQLEKEMEKQDPKRIAEFRKQLADSNVTIENFRDVIGFGNMTIGGVHLFLGLLTVIGAVRMLMLKSYGLSVFVSVLAVVPCLSLTGCLLLGQLIGIWSLIVLLNQEVRAAFR